MIELLISGIVASGIVFFILKSSRLPIWVCASGSILIFLMISGLTLYAFSKIDEPPPGARTITQEELEEAESPYSIRCSPKIQKVDGGSKLMPCIEWEQSSSGSLTYSATTFYRRQGSSDLIRSFELHGGGTKDSNTSSSTVELANIAECLVLITVFDEDKNVKRRTWYASKTNAEQVSGGHHENRSVR